MSVAVESQHVFRLVGRSFLAFVLSPVSPLEEWICELDAWMERSKGFFTGRPVMIDLAHIELARTDVAALLAQLQARGLRIIGVEGVDPAWVGPGLGPLPASGSVGGRIIEVPDEEALAHPREAAPADREPTGLVIDFPVRSGQSIVFPNGDVTVTGSVASGSEIIAGGSIHIYGTLRGRAIAGSSGNALARIFCSTFDAELLAIGGLYKTADAIEPELRGRAVHAWLDGEVLMMTPQN